MSEVLGKLQNDLALQSMQFTVSPAAKTSRMKNSSTQHWKPLKIRAKQVVKKLGRKNYKIVDINISTSGTRGVRPQYQMRAMAMDSAEANRLFPQGSKR